MLINNTAYKEQYTANGLTVNFAITFPFFVSSHVKVFTSDADSEEATLVDSSLYTITGAGSESGGTLTFATAPTSGITIAILRDMPITQTYEYTELDNFPAKSHEDALAKLTMICQEIKEETDRSIKVPATSTDPAEDFALQLFEASADAQQSASEAAASATAAENAKDSVVVLANAAKAEITALKVAELADASTALDGLVADAEDDFEAAIGVKTTAALALVDVEVTKAEDAATSAAASASAAASSEASATADALSAETNAANAASSATAADQSYHAAEFAQAAAETAQEEAESAKNIAVAAKQDAASSELAAAASETNAASSEGQARAYAASARADATSAAASETRALASKTAAVESEVVSTAAAASANAAWSNLASATATSESVDSWQEASVTLTDGEFHFTIPRAEDGMVPVGLSIAEMAIGANNGHLTFTVHQCNFDTADAHIDEYGNLILQLIDAEDI